MRMMRIEFAMDNDSFSADQDRDEVALILGEIAGKYSIGVEGGKVLDANGDTIGQWSVERGEQVEEVNT